MKAVNRTEPVVELELGGETYELFFSLDAIAAAEEVTGEALITGINQKTVKAPRLLTVRALLWACMLPRRPETTFEEAKEMVTQFTWQAVWGAVLEAWAAGMRKPKDGAGDPTPGQG